MTRVLLAFLALVAASSLYLEGRQPPHAGPFVLLVTQTAPAVELFVHRPSGICFLGYGKGGLVIVPRTVCESLPPFPPIGPPISLTSPYASIRHFAAHVRRRGEERGLLIAQAQAHDEAEEKFDRAMDEWCLIDELMNEAPPCP